MEPGLKSNWTGNDSGFGNEDLNDWMKNDCADEKLRSTFG
jgi:hypothetical protein